MTDTIFALASGSLGCGVAVIRVSGPKVVHIADRYCGGFLFPRQAAYRSVCDPRDGTIIDQGLILFFPGPNSFTGENCLEFQLHGSRAVVARLFLALNEEEGCRMAEPGEFIRRSFENGKLPLTSVEGIGDLIDARTESQRRQALSQAGGHLADRASFWRGALLEGLSLLEAEIDFVDEGDAPSGVISQVRITLVNLLNDLQNALVDADRGERIRSGFRVALAGPPNAGKSSLMNALVRRDVAIVSEHAGTTRDVIEVEFDLGGYSVLVSDTAGLRETNDPVEIIGIERTEREISKADLVLWLNDARSKDSLSSLRQFESLHVATKMDLADGLPPWADVGLSAVSGDGISHLFALLEDRASRALSGEMPLVTNLRQRACVSSASRHLQSAMSHDAQDIELIADDLRRVAAELEALMGRIGTEDILGAIFSRFCMGK